jgi:hypothetical protein
MLSNALGATSCFLEQGRRGGAQEVSSIYAMVISPLIYLIFNTLIFLSDSLGSFFCALASLFGILAMPSLSPATGSVERGLALFEDILHGRKNIHTSPIAWSTVASWDDENPFLGYRPTNSASYNIYYKDTPISREISQMYKQIGAHGLQAHPASHLTFRKYTVRGL